MTDREKVQDIFANVEKMRETHPLAAKLFDEIFKAVKPQLDQYLTDNEAQQSTEIRTGRE